MLASVWGMVLATVVLRRMLGDVALADTAVFATALLIAAASVAFQAWVFLDLRSRVRRGDDVPGRRWIVIAAVEFAFPTAFIAWIQEHDPGHAQEVLTAPVILAYVLLIAVSPLRLSPRVSLSMGLTSLVMHWCLVLNAVRLGEIESHRWPALFTFGIFLALIGVACASVAANLRSATLDAIGEAVAAERSRGDLALVERDLQVAREIQQGLMPSSPPDAPGFDIAGLARPAQETGGDYYDWHRLHDQRTVVLIADVTGHGIGPALVMAVCRAYARATAPDAGNAEELLNALNDLVYNDLAESGRFITMAVAVLTCDGRLNLLSAGHGPSLLYRAATGRIEVFGGDGPPLGIGPGQSYGPHVQRDLQPGDVLLLATDGFIEWARQSDRERFGLEGLQNALRAHAAGTAREILEGIDRAASDFSQGTPQEDDTTAVVIKRIVG